MKARRWRSVVNSTLGIHVPKATDKRKDAPPSAPILVSPQLLGLFPRCLRQIRDCYTLEWDCLTKRKPTLRILRSLQAEAVILRQNPQQFVDVQAYEAFFAEVDQMCHQIMEIIRLQVARENVQEDLIQMRDERNYCRNRPTYVKELMAQPWQQFLHPEAPGWFKEEITPTGVKSRQMIPNGGVRLLAAWEDEVRQIHEFLDPVSYFKRDQLQRLLTVSSMEPALHASNLYVSNSLVACCVLVLTQFIVSTKFGKEAIHDSAEERRCQDCGISGFCLLI